MNYRIKRPLGSRSRKGVSEDSCIKTNFNYFRKKVKENKYYPNTVVKNNNLTVRYLERIKLIKMLSYGKFYSAKEFIDPRHKILASCLECFINIYPVNMLSCYWFTMYLEDCEMLNKCGGKIYISELFKGVEGSYEQ